MKGDFDTVVNRKSTESIKWNKFDEDVLPMWIADMDFKCPDLLLQSIVTRTNHGIFGYSKQSDLLRQILVERVARLHNWAIDPETLLFFPSVLNSISLFFAVNSEPGDEVIVFTPSYPPLLTIPEKFDVTVKTVDLVNNDDCGYKVDFETFEAAISEKTRILLLCNPHNPTGRCFTREELVKIAAICQKHEVLIVSDDIHSDLVYTNNSYTPIASISKDIEDMTITFFGPGKTFNVPGLKISMAIVTNPEIRKRLMAISEKFHMDCNILSYSAAETAYGDCQPWVAGLNSYLENNRDILFNFITKEFPDIKILSPESTFLAWLDCRQLDLKETPADFFLRKAQIAFNDGATFGSCGEGFVRMNFGCPRSILDEALDRMKFALEK